MSIFDDFEEIWNYSHYWNWAPDWLIVKEIYEKIPTSYSVLIPFAYSYFEEMIRTTTSEYSLPLVDHNRRPVKVKVGMALIKLAIEENKGNAEYVSLLEKAKSYFTYTEVSNDENGRNNVMHGRLHPRFWRQEDFEELIHNIAEMSKYARF